MPENGRDADGRFAPGNRLWEARSSAGRNPIFGTADDLWKACGEYFEWVVQNPLHEGKVTAYEGAVQITPLAKMRAMTLGGLCIFLGISRDTWNEWRNTRSDLSQVIGDVEEIIREQKFTGAAAGLLNSNIIARDLGLAEKQEHTGKDGGPIETETRSDLDLARHLALLLERGAQSKD